MRVIDERGRLFGKVNVIDLAAAIVVIVLIPIAYGAYLVFRPPVPKILAVAPTSQPPAAEMRVRITGENFRPYLRAVVGPRNGVFLAESARQAEIRFVDVPPGTYDVALYDDVKEVARLNGAITIQAPPAPPRQMIAVRVRFVDLQSSIEKLSVGDQDADGARLVALEGSRQTLHGLQVMQLPSGTANIPQPYLVVGALVHVPAAEGRYKGESVTVGGSILFVTPVVTVRGTILSVEPLKTAAATTGQAPR